MPWITLEKPDSQPRRDEVSHLGIHTAAIRTNAQDFLRHRVGNLSLKKDSRQDSIQKATHRAAHDEGAKILADGGVSEIWIVMTGNDDFGERRKRQWTRLEVDAHAALKILERSVVRPVVPLLRRADTAGTVRLRSSVL